MTKTEEIQDPSSCLNKGLPTELKFVIREVDIAAPETIREWCRLRIKYGKNEIDDVQIQEALEMAANIEVTLMNKRHFR